MVNFTPITKELMRKEAPSIFADTPDRFRSNRYTMVKSEIIIDLLAERDWLPHRFSEVKQRRSQKLWKPSDPGHQKHMVVFRNKNEDLSFEDPRVKVINHGNYHLDSARVYPEIVLFNSSDGTCVVKLSGGLFALICANGLIIPISTIGCFQMKHQGFDPQEIYDGADDFSREVPKLLEVVSSWSDIKLERPQQLEMATKAVNLGWGEDSPVVPNQLLIPNREADTGNDLWSTFNVIQEHTIKGGFKAERTKRKTRPITNITQTKEINEGLWNIAEEMYELVA